MSDYNFFCPRCGSSYFGSDRTRSRFIGHCHGSSRCGFTWDRDDPKAECRAFPATATRAGGCFAIHGSNERCGKPAVATLGDNYFGDGRAWRACQQHADGVLGHRRVAVYWDKDLKKPGALTPRTQSPPASVSPPAPPKRCVACNAEDGFVVLRTVVSGSTSWYCMDCDPSDLPPTGVITGERAARYRRQAEQLVRDLAADKLGLTAPEVLRPARGWDRNFSL